MDELYFWGSAVIVGLLLLKLLPASKLSSFNKKMREKIAGPLISVLYILIFVLLFIGVYGICYLLSANVTVICILTGAVLGAFIGLIPLVDSRHAK